MPLNLALGLMSSALGSGSAGGPTLPTGAIGVWYADQYSGSDHPYVPNALSALPVSKNLFGPPRRLFANTAFWGNLASVTVTDGAGTSQDGISGDASRYNGTGDSYIQKTMVLAAGTYTMCANVKSNTGSSQDFRMRNFTSTLSATKTATTSWQRFTFTMALGAGSNLFQPIGSADGVTALDLLFDDVELFAGSSDLHVDLAGHLFLGIDSATKVPSYASGALDFSVNSGSVGLIQFPTATTGSQWTAIAVGSKVAAGSAYQAFLSKIQSFSTFSAMFEQGTNNASYFTANNYGPSGGVKGSYYSLLSTGYHCFAQRYDGTEFNTFLGDVKLFNKVASFSSVSLQDLFAGWVNNSSFTCGYKIAAIALYNSALTDVQVRVAYSALVARVALSGITLVDSSLRTVVSEGDSITAGQLATGYSILYGTNASPSAVIVNNAVGSATLSGNGGNSLDGRKVVNKAIIPPIPGSRKFIYTVLIGKNDGPPGVVTAAQYAADIATHIAEMRTAGYTHVVLGTLLPSSDAAYNTWRNALNAIITGVGWAATNGVDAIADYAANATIGTDAAGSNATYYPDGIHPSAACYAIMEPIYRAAVNAL